MIAIDTTRCAAAHLLNPKTPKEALLTCFFGVGTATALGMFAHRVAGWNRLHTGVSFATALAAAIGIQKIGNQEEKSMGEVLFEITEENLETGMRGYPVGYCVTSQVDPEKGLSYAGIPISGLYDRQPEEIIYLLYYGQEGTFDQVVAFSKELQRRSHVKPELREGLSRLSREGHPMKIFSAALLAAGQLQGTGNYREDCLNLIATIPEIAALTINHHAGVDTPPSRAELGYIENFAQMLQITPNGEDQQEAFRLFNILHLDHGGGNLSTFVGKAVASGGEDMYGSIAAAMCGLEGPKHGKANQDCLQFVQEVLAEIGEEASQEEIEELIRGRLERHQLIFGFGHAVLRVEDPRATIFYNFAEKRFQENPLTRTALQLRTAGKRVLSENPKITNPNPNVDAISGTVLKCVGVDNPNYFTVFFGMSRAVGIAIQILYEREEARDGKGTPIVRPRYLYDPSRRHTREAPHAVS